MTNTNGAPEDLQPVDADAADITGGKNLVKPPPSPANKGGIKGAKIGGVSRQPDGIPK